MRSEQKVLITHPPYLSQIRVKAEIAINLPMVCSTFSFLLPEISTTNPSRSCGMCPVEMPISGTLVLSKNLMEAQETEARICSKNSTLRCRMVPSDVLTIPAESRHPSFWYCSTAMKSLWSCADPDDIDAGNQFTGGINSRKSGRKRRKTVQGKPGVGHVELFVELLNDETFS